MMPSYSATTARGAALWVELGCAIKSVNAEVSRSSKLAAAERVTSAF
jgi:hypothetical protein